MTKEIEILNSKYHVVARKYWGRWKETQMNSGKKTVKDIKLKYPSIYYHSIIGR